MKGGRGWPGCDSCFTSKKVSTQKCLYLIKIIKNIFCIPKKSLSVFVSANFIYFLSSGEQTRNNPGIFRRPKKSLLAKNFRPYNFRILWSPRHCHFRFFIHICLLHPKLFFTDFFPRFHTSFSSNFHTDFV